ncbi:Sensor domain-containing protein OS=Streptomyces tendae OX=1932 GN=GUR47_06800 PE=4 SV=1 [Streptomyces tendae]
MSLSLRFPVSALTALTTAALAAGTVLMAPAAGAAPKAAAPTFLSAAQLPPHPTSSWTAGPVTDGFPEELGLCVSTEGVPSYDYRYRQFRTDLDSGAVQLTVVAGTAAQAKGLAKHYDDLIRTCAHRIEESTPDVEAEGRDYGTLAVEEGARVRGLHTETSWGATDVSLFSVGRDGRTVTVVEWGQMGDFTDAPVAAFKKTTTTAVDKLY